MIRIYKRRPLFVAAQWTGDNFDEISNIDRSARIDRDNNLWLGSKELPYQPSTTVWLVWSREGVTSMFEASFYDTYEPWDGDDPWAESVDA